MPRQGGGLGEEVEEGEVVAEEDFGSTVKPHSER